MHYKVNYLMYSKTFKMFYFIIYLQNELSFLVIKTYKKRENVKNNFIDWFFNININIKKCFIF